MRTRTFDPMAGGRGGSFGGDVPVALKSDEVIEALPATREESELLTIPKKASILSISRTIMTTEETPIEVACSRYRGDRYRASIRVPTTTIE